MFETNISYLAIFARWVRNMNDRNAEVVIFFSGQMFDVLLSSVRILKISLCLELGDLGLMMKEKWKN